MFKPKERAYVVDRLTTGRAEYPVTHYKVIRTTIHWIQQELHSNSLHTCANIPTYIKNEGLDLYKEWNTYWTNPKEGKSTKNAKIQSRTILVEILRNIFSKDNPVMVLKFHHVTAQIPQDILGVYTYLLVRDQFPQANLDVIVLDIG